MGILSGIFDNRRSGSLSSRMRRRRFQLPLRLIQSLIRDGDGSVEVLDLGGTQHYWESMGAADLPGLRVTLLNLDPMEAGRPNFSSVQGDARDLEAYGDKQFGLVFSQSCIEHVGCFEDQERMAREVGRVGVWYYVQAPYRYFPVEPHFLFPGFQFLPLSLRAWLHSRFRLGWMGRAVSYAEARKACEEVRLPSIRAMKRLFPDAVVVRERFFGLVKSLAAVRCPAELLRNRA